MHFRLVRCDKCYFCCKSKIHFSSVSIQNEDLWCGLTVDLVKVLDSQCFNRDLKALPVFLSVVLIAPRVTGHLLGWGTAQAEPINNPSEPWPFCLSLGLSVKGEVHFIVTHKHTPTHTFGIPWLKWLKRLQTLLDFLVILFKKCENILDIVCPYSELIIPPSTSIDALFFVN